MKTDAPPTEPDVAPVRRVPGLSARLLVLTILFVMLAEVLIYVPSIANFRRTWLNDRIAVAQIAAMVLDASPTGAVPIELERKLVAQVGAVSVAIRSGGARRLLAVTDMPPAIDHDVDMRAATPWSLAVDALETLVSKQPRAIRVVGPGTDDVEFVELVLDERPLRDAMVRYSINILILSLIISAITALLVLIALHRLIVAPVRRLTSSIIEFGRDPENTSLVITPSSRGDEIGLAERALSTMQWVLATELREKKHLAALGLAVSKISHDLRNILASAQLFSDRLAAVGDPTVQRLAPRIVSALDRAIGLCRSTLAYGKVVERPPQKQTVLVSPMVDDLRDLLGLGEGHPVTLVNLVPPGLGVDADPEQLSRVLLNLGRNAVQVLTDTDAVGAKVITVAARRAGDTIEIEVSDTGPGVPVRAREHLFEAFQSSTRPGGTGLGLAIAAELVAAHSGRIELLETPTGASFRITLPGRVVRRA
ncbi:ATP-binding protein [Alsobacter sp. R-9]